MKAQLQSVGYLVSLFLGLFMLPHTAFAQITGDNTLSTLVVTPDNLNFTIEGGDRSGNNLFHSFQEFSIPTGGSAFFNNALDIENIFTRITGNNLSDIDGFLSTNKAPNFFLINPNGIQFGANARFNVGGSFIASTAESLVFEDGNFSAINPSSSPLLTLNIPIGLQYGSTPAPINVTGAGHNLTSGDFQPTNRFNHLSQLIVNPGQTLALIGGDIVLDGGTLSAEGGNLELGAVGHHSQVVQVSLLPIASGWTLDYGEIQNFADIQLNNQALVDVSSPLLAPTIPGGSIQAVGNNIELTAGSRIFSQNLSNQGAGNTTISSSGLLNIIGIDSNGTASGIRSEAFLGTGQASNISVSSQQIIIREGADILSDSFGIGLGGEIQVTASELIEVDGFSPTNFINLSGIGSNAFGLGNAGDVMVSTQRLHITNRGGISSVSLFGSASSGNITLNTTESIEILGGGAGIVTPSGITTATGTPGHSGDININTSRLILREGGGIDSSTGAIGNAGNITISASESVEVNGIASDSINPSLISASARILDPTLQQLLGFPAQPSGLSGNITIDTPLLQVTNGGQVTVRNDGIGNAGELVIESDSILISDSGRITASTASGEGGNITLISDNLVLLRRRGVLSATAAGEIGNGGNSIIDATLLVALEESQIVANAVMGSGGNISIQTTGLFLAPDTRIEVSSTFGVEGMIRLITPELDNAVGLIELPTSVLKVNTEIVAGCSTRQGDRFIIQGRGGLPTHPGQSLRQGAILSDFGNFPESSSLPSSGEPSALASVAKFQHQQIIEAQSWIINSQGIVELVAQVPQISFQFFENAMTSCHQH